MLFRLSDRDVDRIADAVILRLKAKETKPKPAVHLSAVSMLNAKPADVARIASWQHRNMA